MELKQWTNIDTICSICSDKVKFCCNLCEKFYCEECLTSSHNIQSLKSHLIKNVYLINLDLIKKKESLDMWFGKLLE